MILFKSCSNYIATFLKTPAVYRPELPVLYSSFPVMGDSVGGSSKKDDIYVYIYMINSVVQQKLTLYCKALIL